MTEKKPLFINFKKLSDEISSLTVTIKFAHGLINIQQHEVTNDVIMTWSSLNVTAAIYECQIANYDNRLLKFIVTWTNWKVVSVKIDRQPITGE